MENIRKGYVSIHREILTHWIWQEKPFSKGQAWIDLILLANYQTKKFAYKDGVITGQRGTVYRSISWLADRWGWSRDKVRRFLDLLKNDGMVTMVATTHQTTVTLVNYGKYQDPPTTSDTANTTTDKATNTTTSRQQADSRPTASRQQADTYNKGNKGNKSNQGNNTHTAEPIDGQQTPEEVAEAQRWFNEL